MRDVNRNDEAGFALTELMLVAALLSVVVGAILLFLETAVKVAPEYQERGHVVQEGRVGLEQMTRELRQASTATITATPAPPATATSQEVAFTTWVRAGGGAGVQRQVAYRCSYQTDECFRYEDTDSNPTTPLAETHRLATGVQNDPATQPVFTGTPSAAGPRYVGITLALRSAGSSEPILLRDGVRLRNEPAV